MRIVSWNVKRLSEPWRLLAADSSVDIALLQEATLPPADIACEVVPPRDSPCKWTMAGYRMSFRTAIARISDRVMMRGRRTIGLGEAGEHGLPVSREGSLAIADIESGGETITCISAYAVWENMLYEPPRRKSEIFSDGSAHRLISDISALVVGRTHKILVAGDLNILRGYGEHGSRYWAARYQTVFDRMAALGLRFVGPEAPHGRQAEPWPSELPGGSKNVPTYHSTTQTRATATRQLDFVFASESLADRVRTKAMNGEEDWGPKSPSVIVDHASG